MKIILVSPLPPPSGGIASWTVRYKAYCDANEIEVQIVNIAMQGKRATKETMRLNPIIEIKRNITILKRMYESVKNADEKTVVHLCTSCQPIGVLRDCACAMLVKRKMPLVLHCHCNIEDQIGKKKISHIALRSLLNRANKVIVLNGFSKEYVDSIVPDKSVFVPNFADEKFIDEHHKINDEIKNILYVGHVERAKGIEEIVGVAQILKNITFNVVGAIREDISNIDIPDNVKLLGKMEYDDVKAHYKNSDLFLFPSKSEGFSLAMLEAMGMGLPVIASNVGANQDMIRNDGGRIVNNISIDDIQKSIEQLQSPEIRQRMSRRNVKCVKDNYMIEKVMRQYMSIYYEIL